MRKHFVPNMNVDASKIHFKNDKFDENVTNVSSALKYLNDKIKNVLSFDENGNLSVTIDGISKTFIPKE